MEKDQYYYQEGDVFKVKDVEPKEGSEYFLKELQEYVGGYIEVYPVGGKMAVFNEEGRIMGLPVNPLASDYVGFMLVGNVLIIDRKRIS